jgi:Protease inhibitor Inh
MMQMTSRAASALFAAAFALGGCQSSRMSDINTAPEPLPAAPSGVVQQSQLPPPTNPAGTQAAAVDPAQFPAAPTTPGGIKKLGPATPAAGTQVASAEPTGPDLTVGGIAGVWNVNVAGQSCKVATPQTKFGQGFRAGPLKCPGEIANVKSWNVAGKQLTLYDEGGTAVANLYGAGGGYSGQTSGGSAISLTR